MNKYCGEHLIIVNESPLPDPPYPLSPNQRSLPHNTNDEENSIEQDGPIAEALIQSDQMLHHLKILKSSPSETEYERRKTAAEIEQIKQNSEKRKGVYSQVGINPFFHFFLKKNEKLLLRINYVDV